VQFSTIDLNPEQIQLDLIPIEDLPFTILPARGVVYSNGGRSVRRLRTQSPAIP
jgi:hypothetical protein